jgi:putative nucleotidyltransferase with HDIG domain
MRLGLRYKIIVPFGVLLLFVGTTGTALASAQLSSGATAEFDAGLLRSSVLANTQLSQIEADRLTMLRAATNTVGVAEAVESQDRTALSRLLVPLAANAPVELDIRIVDDAGQELIAISGTPAQAKPPAIPQPTWAGIAAVDHALAGDKDSFGERYLFLDTGSGSPRLYWVSPVRDGAQVVGGVLLGQTLDGIARQISGSLFYDQSGRLLATSVPNPAPLPTAVRGQITGAHPVRVNGAIRGHTYGTLFSEWTMRGSRLGYLGIEQAADSLASSVNRIRLILALLFTGAAVLTLLVGSVLASRITRPIDRLVRAIKGVSAGDLTQRAEVDSTDEIGYLASAFNEMTRSLQDKTEELEETYFASMEALARAIDARDPSTYGHSARVAAVSLVIADAMGLAPESREALRRGALLHDIGKIGVADRILRKPGPLTRIETADMREHSRIGYQMLKGLRFMQPSLDGVLHHHERWDGGGYPDRLAGNEIPLSVRILAVADVFDAITADRPYRAGLAFGEAIKTIEKGAGTQFDPQVVDAFLGCRRTIIELVQRMGKVTRPDADESAAQEIRLEAA